MDFLKPFLKPFLNGTFFSARQEDHFQKRICPKQFPLDFVKLGPEILYLFLAEKMVVCLFCFVCLLQYFVRFWLTF